MKTNLADIHNIKKYSVIIEFSKKINPKEIKNLCFASLETEIDANSVTNKALQIRKKYGRLPYAAPIYIWIVYKNHKNGKIDYIGQTTKQSIQNRFKKHQALTNLLASYINKPRYTVFFKICTRLDILYNHKEGIRRYAIEHFDTSQVKRIIDDVEAWLIYKYKPRFNTKYKSHKKKYWKSFQIFKCTGLNL